MSNRERISWVGLIINLVIGGWYFRRVLALPADADVFGPHMAMFAVGLVTTAIIVAVVCEILLRVVQKGVGGGTDAALQDERDALIDLKAVRTAHGIFVVAIIVVLVQIALIDWSQRYRGRRPEPETILGLLGTGPLEAMHVAQMLLAALTLGAIALNASRIFYYRRGY
jgi:hypothetical protein